LCKSFWRQRRTGRRQLFPIPSHINNTKKSGRARCSGMRLRSPQRGGAAYSVPDTRSAGRQAL